MQENDLYFKVLKILRSKKMTQMELAQKMGIKQASLSKILSGQNSTKISTIQKISKALGVSVGYLTDEEQDNIKNSKTETDNIINLVMKLFEEQNKRFESEISLLKKDNEILKTEVELLKKK